MLIPAQNSNKTNYKIQDYFANRQIKEDVKCNNLLSNEVGNGSRPEQTRAGPKRDRQQQARPGSDAQRVSASIKVNF
jgi:hypothetical protein